ncbi:MAG: hypothetical protein LH624_09620 [Cryobacterium sp.]|nr:hypothetical protein [Cryobacterium sp.]
MRHRSTGPRTSARGRRTLGAVGVLDAVNNPPKPGGFSFVVNLLDIDTGS